MKIAALKTRAATTRKGGSVQPNLANPVDNSASPVDNQVKAKMAPSKRRPINILEMKSPA